MPNKQQHPEPGGMYETLVRRPDGHETIVRLRAQSADEAKKGVVELGVPAEQVVDSGPPAA